jgi:hypothetical protein
MFEQVFAHVSELEIPEYIRGRLNFNPDVSDWFRTRRAMDVVKDCARDGIELPAEFIQWADTVEPFGVWMESPQTRDGQLDRGKAWPQFIYDALGTVPPEPFHTWEEDIDFSRTGKGWDY